MPSDERKPEITAEPSRLEVGLSLDADRLVRATPPPAAPSVWVQRPRPRPGTRLRLFCLPYAGGAASAYRGWGDLLPPEVEVCPIQLPGRGPRFREAPIARGTELAAAVVDGLHPFLDAPFALFGHSMGALVAFELCRELRRRGASLPVLLAVSGRHAPHRPEPNPPIAHLPDAEFLEQMLARYDAIPPEVLAEEELLGLLLPALRADMLVLETYAYAAEPPLDCALSCFGGTDDRHAPPAELEAWREQTRGSFAMRTFPGRHFFIESSRSAVLEALGRILAPWTTSAREGT